MYQLKFKFLFFCFFLWFVSKSANTNLNILYTTNNELLFSPLIEAELHNLKHIISDEKIINKATYLDRIISNKNLEISIRKTLLYYNNTLSFELSEDSERFRSQLGHLLLENDYFLDIKFVKIESLIEIQFYLFNILGKEKTNTEFPVIDINNPLKISSIFFKLTDDTQKIKKYIGISLRKIFTDANHLPVAIISLKNGVTPNEFVQKTGENLTLFPDYSYDLDYNDQKLNFTWKQIFLNKQEEINPNNTLSYKQVDGNCIIECKKEGIFYIELTADDQIYFNSKDTLILSIAQAPEIKLNINRYYSRKIVGIFGKSSEDELIVDIGVFSSNYSDIKPEHLKVNVFKEDTDTFSILSQSFTLGQSPSSLMKTPINIQSIEVSKIEQGLNVRVAYLNTLKDQTLYFVWKKGSLKSNEQSLIIKHRRIIPIYFISEFLKQKIKNDSVFLKYSSIGLGVGINFTKKIQAEMLIYDRIDNESTGLELPKPLLNSFMIRLGSTGRFFSSKTIISNLGLYYYQAKVSSQNFNKGNNIFSTLGFYTRSLIPIFGSPRMLLNISIHTAFFNKLGSEFANGSDDYLSYRLGFTYLLSR